MYMSPDSSSHHAGAALFLRVALLLHLCFGLAVAPLSVLVAGDGFVQVASMKSGQYVSQK